MFSYISSRDGDTASHTKVNLEEEGEEGEKYDEYEEEEGGKSECEKCYWVRREIDKSPTVFP